MNIHAIQRDMALRYPGVGDLLVGQQIDLGRFDAAHDDHFSIGIGQQVTDRQGDRGCKGGAIHRCCSLADQGSRVMAPVARCGQQIVGQIDEGHIRLHCKIACRQSL